MRCQFLSPVFLAASLGVLLSLTGCGANASNLPLDQRTIRVVTTTTMITDAVKIVAGKRVEVVGLMGPGVDPHEHEASAGDMKSMEQADVIFYNGLHLEGKMGDILAHVRGGTKTFAVTEGIPKSLLRSVPGFEGGYDPHVWFDVTLWSKVVEHIRDKFIEIDPTHAEIYRANAKQYLEELAQLHEHLKTQARRIPEMQRVLVTAHDAFGYFARAYGFEVRGLQGVSTAAEIGISDVQELAKFIAARRIQAMFVESSVNPKNIRAVQDAVKSLGFTVGIGGELFSDSLGDTDKPDGTYVGMMKANLETMVKALAPAE